MEQRRSDPADDMISALVHGRLGSGEEVSAAKILGIGFTMVTGGNDTTTGLLGGALELLTRHPDQRALLLEDLGAVRGRGRGVPATHVTGAGTGAHHDARRRDRGPDDPRRPQGAAALRLGQPRRARVRSGRRARATSAPASGATSRFSYGPHHCIGAAAARLQARIALEELLCRVAPTSASTPRPAASPRGTSCVATSRCRSVPEAARDACCDGEAPRRRRRSTGGDSSGASDRDAVGRGENGGSSSWLTC